MIAATMSTPTSEPDDRRSATPAAGKKIPKQEQDDYEWEQKQYHVPTRPQGGIVHVMALLFGVTRAKCIPESRAVNGTQDPAW